MYGITDYEQKSGGDSDNKWAYFRFGRYYYYVIKAKDSEGNVSHKYYFAEKGTIQLQNENGESLKCYDEETFEQYLEWFNGNTNKIVNQEKAMNTYLGDTFYTVPELGKIKIITIENDNDVSYTFSSKELDYISDTEIANCTVPVEVLVDFLNISASTEFLSAFEELIKGQEVIMKLYSLTTTKIVDMHVEQEATPSVDITATIAYEMDEGFVGPVPQNNNGDGQHLYEQIVHSETFSPFTITEDTHSEHTSIDYELALEKANTWYAKMERELQKTINPPSETTRQYTAYGYVIQGSGDSAFRDSRIDSDNQKVLTGYLEFDTLWARIQNVIPSIHGCHATSKGSTILVDSTTVDVQDGTREVKTTKTVETLNKGTWKYDNNTSAFLGLWKNIDGKYHRYAKYDANTGKISGYDSKALFDPDGKKVSYHDLYGDDDAYIGDLFVNADEELFELLASSASSDRTESYANIMRYILYRYTGEDYGVTDFEQLLKLLGLNNFKSVKGVNGTSALSEYLKAWENFPLYNYLNGNGSYSSVSSWITSDGKEYIMFDDGYNTRNFGFGICFYAFGGFQNQSYFSAEGVDITDSKYQNYGVSTLSVEIVDRIKESIIENRRQDARDMARARNITLTDSQIDAIAACMYQGWQMGDFLDAYKQYGLTDYIRSYSSGMNSNCIPSSRGDANWELFSREIYRDPAGNEIVVPSGGGSILESAEKIHTYMEQNNYSYCILGGEDNSHPGSCGLDSTFEESKTNHHLTCCATFVSWVLRDAGLIDQTIHYVGSEGSSGLNNILESTYHWTRVNSSELQPGDVMVYVGQHIEIYAGNGTKYNAGDVDSIQNAAPSSQNATPDYGLRAP